MTKFSIGIDTGGTYTDAVLIEADSGKIVHSAKERTIHHDLSIGVGKALESIFSGGIQPTDIVKMAVSTTLATNAVVEERGARVGLFVIGMVKHFKLPVVANVFLKGGHDILGREEEPLDLNQLVDTVEGLKNDVDSYAICSSMSIKNPAHELVAQKAVTLVDPKPVFCSHEISVHAGMQERAATACLHARLMPLMEAFINSVGSSMETIGLTCPVVIICGDGKKASLDVAVKRAAVTVASGPAATVHYGVVSGDKNALIVDVGGTTTDVCMIRDGKALMSEHGCRIGPWQTHVEAVDMYTGAGGGDSHVLCSSDGVVALENFRVQPLSMTVNMPDPEEWLGRDGNDSLVLPMVQAGGDTPPDEILAFLLHNGPATPGILAQKTRISGVILEKRLERLVYKQKIVRSGFTPTDALHVLGLLNIGNSEASLAGAEILAKEGGFSVEQFCHKVLEIVEDRIETIILDYLGRKIWGHDHAAMLVGKRNNDLFEMSYTLKVPIVGIGAASIFFLENVAKRLGTSVTFPQYYQVGNAMGAGLIAAGL